MASHSVTCHPTEVTFPPSTQPKLVIDLATLEGCKAEFTSWLVKYQDGVPAPGWSFIAVLTGHDMGKLRSRDERR